MGVMHVTHVLIPVATIIWSDGPNAKIHEEARPAKVAV